jgi:hypothetical protein
VYYAWREKHQVWQDEDDALYNLARDDVEGMSWVVRQHYKLLPNDPNFLKLDDIDIRREFHALVMDAYRQKHGKLPERSFGGGFDDLMSLISRGKVPELVDEADFHPIDPDSV